MANVLFSLGTASSGVGTLNAYEHVPQTNQKLPVLLFLPGKGEIGTDASKLLINGPSYFIQNGWNPQNMIIVSVQPNTEWANPVYVDNIVNAIMARYSNKSDGRLYATGLSAGAYAIDNYIGQSQSNSSKITAVISMSAPEPESYFNGAYFTQPAWGFCGNQDSWYVKMQALFTSLGKKFTTYSGGHGGWNTYYDPNYKENNQSIYDFLLSQGTPSNPNIPDPTTPKEVILVPSVVGGGITTTGIALGLNPGDTLILKGNYNYINITGITGTSDKRITILADGEVTIGGNGSYAWAVYNSSYFDIQPTTSRGILKINGGTAGANAIGLGLNKSNNFTLRNLNATNVSVPIMMKTTPTSDPNTYGDDWAYENILIEYNNIDTVQGEGMYLGHSNSGPESVIINGIATNVYAFRLKNVTVQNNTINGTGWDGIQLTCGDGVIIQNNTITNYGTQGQKDQNFGIICAANNPKILNNKVHNGTGTGITTSFNGDLELASNEIISAYGTGQDAIYVNSHIIKSYTGGKPNIHDNYIEHCQRNCIRVANTDGVMISGTIKDNQYKDSLGVFDASNSTLTNNTEVTDPNDPGDNNPPTTVVPVKVIHVVIMSDGSKIELDN